VWEALAGARRPAPAPPVVAGPIQGPVAGPDDPVIDDVFSDWNEPGPMKETSAQNASAATAPGAPPVALRFDREAPTATGPAAPSAGASGADPWSTFVALLGLQDEAAADGEALARRAGTMVLLLLECLADLLGARAELKRELRAEDRTMLSNRDNNPLKLRLSVAELAHYLFEQQTNGGFMPAERALRESLADLRVHEHAAIAAARAAVEGALREFDPALLRPQLAGPRHAWLGALDGARLWTAYGQWYDRQSQQMADWLEAVFTRHYMPAYLRESEELKSAIGKG
jgi:FHA domain-containing protein